MAKKTDTKTAVETKSVTKAVEKETVKKETVKASSPEISPNDVEAITKEILRRLASN